MHFRPTVKPVSKVPLKVANRVKKLPPSKKQMTNPMRKVPPKGGVRKVGDKQVIIRRNAKFIKRKGKHKNIGWMHEVDRGMSLSREYLV